MKLKPWYKIVTPREDLREGRPLDASEFAVHLDQVRDHRAPDVYQNPESFFARTYLTKNLTNLAAEVLRRLSGIKTETSAIYNMTTQFGGGKTHALTLLYHLANNGDKAKEWAGVKKILEKGSIAAIPKAATAVFVGTEFDSITGRGGDDGTPLRRSPWGEIAYQLGGAESFKIVEEHDKEFMEPKGDVIRAFLPKDRPCLILMDEIINYVSTYRRKGYHNALYNFIQSLSETARGLDNVALMISIPASELSYTDQDESDQQRFKHMLDRLGKAVIMSAETEISEIIRRRLFEWDEMPFSSNGRVLLPRDAVDSCNEFADWIRDHNKQIPSWFPIDNAQEAFAAAYPFHPSVLSVFERKWQSLPRFQQTRGILRLLALWVSKAYQDGFKGANKDPVIGLGAAPLDDSLFRAALFEQLGESRLEGAVTTDIFGKKDSHAVRLDKEAVDTIKNSRLHQKAAAAIFFESNGGQTRTEATLPEIRLDIGEPGLDIGNIETVLETLTETCYFLTVEKNHYFFSMRENLNKRFADRRASVDSSKVDELVRTTIQDVFKKNSSVETIFFPKESNQIADRPNLTFVVTDPYQTSSEKNLSEWIDKMLKEHGASARLYKNALVFCIPENAEQLRDDARKMLAWESIRDDQDELRLEDAQKRQIGENIKKSKRDLIESVWRTYKKVFLLGKENQCQERDFGLVHSSAADNMTKYIVNQLEQHGDVVDKIGPNYLKKYWPAIKEWSTKAVRDAVFASPIFPRLLNPNSIKQTIASGVKMGLLAYVGKSNGDYEPFYYEKEISIEEIEISEAMFILTKETAEEYIKSKRKDPVPPPVIPSGETPPQPPPPVVPPNVDLVKCFSWSGEIPPLKWMNFYQKVLTKYATGKGLKITVNVDVFPDEGISQQKIEETKTALRELGLNDHLKL